MMSVSIDLIQLCLCSPKPPPGGITQLIAVWFFSISVFISMESMNCNHIHLIRLLWLVLLHAKIASMLTSMMSFSQSSKNS